LLIVLLHYTDKSKVSGGGIVYGSLSLMMAHFIRDIGSVQAKHSVRPKNIDVYK